MHLEIKNWLKFANTCYHSAQNMLSPCLVICKLDDQNIKTIILSVVISGCENWCDA